MALWPSKKDKNKPAPLKDIWAQMANEIRPASFDGFVSSQWQPIDENAPYKATYLEASYTRDSKWCIREWIIDDEGFATMETKKSECNIFEALSYIGAFESTQNTIAGGIPHKKTDQSAPGKHYIKAAHEHALFVDADGSVYLNDNGTPANADGARFAVKELALIKALIPPTSQGQTLDLPALYTKSATRPDFGFNLSAAIVANYDVDEQLQLMRIEQALKHIPAHLQSIKSTWTKHNRPWVYRENNNPADTLKGFKGLLTATNDIEHIGFDKHQNLIQTLRIEAQAMYTTFIIQIINSNNLSNLIWKDDRDFFEYQSEEAECWPKVTIKQLEKTIRGHQEFLSETGQDTAHYDYVLPMVMAEYTPAQYTEIFNDFCDRIGNIIENFATYKKAIIQSYGQKVLDQKPEEPALPQPKALPTPQPPQGVS